MTSTISSFLEHRFRLAEHGTRVRTEVLAGCTTFVTMAYIIFVNPQMMAAAGMDQGASFVATCLASALACLVMGLYANWPVGLAPGMGMNAFFTWTVVGSMGYSWQVGLGAVFLSGVLFVIISVTRLRRWMLNSIPMNLRLAMGCGVGLLMLGGMRDLAWDDASELVPALLTIVAIPLTFSIADGIAVGFITYVSVKLACGKYREITPGVWFLALIFLARFVWI